MRKPVVWQLSVVQFAERAWITGVILGNEPYVQSKKVGKIKNSIRLLSSYFATTYSNKNITLGADGKTISTRTDGSGNFSVFVDSTEVNNVSVFIQGLDNPLKLSQDYPIVFQTSNSPFDIISDLDDTLVESNTAHDFKRVKTLAFTPPEKRKPIRFTTELLNELRDARITYVSKSESNLFGIIASFILHHGLPVGQLVLTPYLRFGQLFSSKKKGLEFKINTINTIICNSASTKQFVLIGDDTQQDMKVYAHIAEQHQNKVLKIYIHKTRKRLVGAKLRYYQQLLNTCVPVLFFSDQNQVQREIQHLKMKEA
ncbi:MAG: App1 family protein [Bacteroidota bacterium]